MSGAGRALAAAALLAASGPAAGCGAEPGGADTDAAPDSVLVEALAEVQLADARAALAPDSVRSPAFGDSLRRVALRAHGLDSAALAARLDALADDPALARATYDAVADRLSTERFAAP